MRRVLFLTIFLVLFLLPMAKVSNLEMPRNHSTSSKFAEEVVAGSGFSSPECESVGTNLS